MHGVVLLALLLQDIDSIAKDLDRANDADKPQLAMQAVQKLRERGVAAVPAIVAWVDAKGQKAMSQIFTQELGAFKDPKIAALLIACLKDKEFFWRPSAAAALAEIAAVDHRDFLRTLLKDHLWGVRTGAILGLERVGDKESIAHMLAMLDDPIYDVRAQAAKSLHAFGDERGLPVLVESLKSSVTWFDIDYGQIAREDAWKFLVKITMKPDAHEAALLQEFREREKREPDKEEAEAIRKAAVERAKGEASLGFLPWETPDNRDAGLKRWFEWIEKKNRAWRDLVPENARCEVDTAEYVFGFELRSCQRGDFFFRIDAKNNLVLGFFNLERAALTKEERERIDKALEKVIKVDRDVPYGIGGCDFEQYYLKTGEKRFSKLWVGQGGRPHDIDGFVKACREIIKAKFGEGAAVEFKDRTDLFRAMD